MPICKKCESYFPYTKQIDGKCRHLGNRKYCLACSPFGSRNTKKLEINMVPDEKFCSWCSEIKIKSEFYDRTDRLGLSHYCRKCSNIQNREIQSKRAKKRKMKLIEKFGGKCEACGYDKNSSALTFHHTNPQDKLFGLSLPNIRSKKWENCVAEARKCELLCFNCHQERHNPKCEI